MGATLMLETKDMGKPTPFVAPSFTIKYDAENSHPQRNFANYDKGIWWIEISSNNDIIGVITSYSIHYTKLYDRVD